MFIHLYAIRDLRNDALEFVFEEFSDYSATRRVKVMLDSQNPALIMYAKYPDDYALFKIGDLDRQTGNIVSDYRHVADFNSLVEGKE